MRDHVDAADIGEGLDEVAEASADVAKVYIENLFARAK